MTEPLWQPSADRIEHALLTRFTRFLNQRHGDLQLDDYPALHAWSLTHNDEFWDAVWDFCSVIGDKRGPVHSGSGMPGTQYFPEAQLNFAENLLERGELSDTALHFRDEAGASSQLSRGQLRQQVARLAAELRRRGLGPGDRVAGMLPNRPETIIAMLAVTSLGGVWSSCSPDFGEGGVIDRFGQIEPSLFIACAGYHYGGKYFDCRDKAVAITRKLDPPLGAILLADHAQVPAPFCAWEDLPDTDEPLRYTRVDFNSPLYILYSSGTTGAPKCIVHGVGGTLLQHLKEHQLQLDIKPQDSMFYYTTCGWMMWNWLASGLASGATLLLFDGSPFSPHPLTLFDYIAEHKASFFGISAKFIDALKSRGLRPGDNHDLSQLRTLASTGSPLVAESFDYCYSAIKADMAVQSISGGTDIVACFVGGNPWQPVYSGEIQGKMLGMATDVCDENGASVNPGEKGDLICRKPFPSMPLGFWNDPDGTRYHQAYYAKIPGVWHHGDYAELTSHRGIVIHGRSDATLNPGGVRIGTAEIYRQVEQVPGVLEALAVGQPWQDDVRIILFVILAEDESLTQTRIDEIRQRIRSGASPRHVPARVVQVTDFPRTRSGKLAELAVRAVIAGDEVKNRHALSNPEALELFRDIPQLKT